MNQEAIISYELGKASKASIELYNVNGDSVALPVNSKMQKSGRHEIILKADLYPPGMYFILLKTDDGLFTNRLNWKQSH